MAVHSRIRAGSTALGALLLLATLGTTGVARATIIEIDALNVINDPTNDSNGLAYLDRSLSIGLSLDDALANARLSYGDARLATPDEFDDLFDAAGLTYAGSLTAASGFDSGDYAAISNDFLAAELIQSLLGATAYGNGTLQNLTIWTDPDGSREAAGTRDYLAIGNREYTDQVWIGQTSLPTPYSDISWLLVSDSGDATTVPTPSTIALLAAGLLGLRARPRGNRVS